MCSTAWGEAKLSDDQVNVTSTSSRSLSCLGPWGRRKFFFGVCEQFIVHLYNDPLSAKKKKAGLSAKEIEATAPFQKQEVLNPISICNLPVAKHSGTYPIYYLCVLWIDLVVINQHRWCHDFELRSFPPSTRSLSTKSLNSLIFMTLVTFNVRSLS